MTLPHPDDQRDLTDLRQSVTRAQLLAQAMVGRNRMRGPSDLDLLDPVILGSIDHDLRHALSLIGNVSERLRIGGQA